jgi:pimeloyl-ACP methyl ester carboxylesterase
MYGRAAGGEVLGHAYGNFVARVVATNHPDRVVAIILAASSGRSVAPEVNTAPFRAGDPTLPEDERLAALPLAFFEHASHALFPEEPAAVADAVLEYLGTLWSSH